MLEQTQDDQGGHPKGRGSSREHPPFDVEAVLSVIALSDSTLSSDTASNYTRSPLEPRRSPDAGAIGEPAFDARSRSTDDDDRSAQITTLGADRRTRGTTIVEQLFRLVTYQNLTHRRHRCDSSRSTGPDR